jgi:hypothetical protein
MGWRIIALICISEKQKYFCKGGLDRANHLDPAQQIRFYTQSAVAPGVLLICPRRQAKFRKFRNCRMPLMRDGGAPTASSNVRYQGQPGRHLLAPSFSQFDPKRSS